MNKRYIEIMKTSYSKLNNMKNIPKHPSLLKDRKRILAKWLHLIIDLQPGGKLNKYG